MNTLVRLSAAVGLLALAQGCGDDGPSDPPNTCSPTAQTAPDPTGAEGYCVDFFSAFCDRAFGDCRALSDGAPFATREECRAQAAVECASEDFSSTWHDAGCGEVCVGFLRGASCATLLSTAAEPQACAAAEGSFPPALFDPITAPTTVTGTISDADPIYDGGHARTYGITLGAGQTVTIETSAGAPPEIFDTVLYLVGPSGPAPLAENDDIGGGNFYSRISRTVSASGDHRIIVRGFASFLVGSYQLTVTVQ
jgi:hypothetical protein